MGRLPHVEAQARVADERGDDDGESEAQRVTLAELLSEHRHLLLIGQPGAGKSTFSDLVVCMLARDLVGPRTPAAAAAEDDKAEDEPALPWRTEYLGLSPERAPPLPALLRVRDLVGVHANGPNRVDDLLEMILDRDEGRGLLAEVKRLINLARALDPLSAYGYEIGPFLDERRADLKSAVMAIFTVEGAAQVPVALRIAAAEVIGRWGDPRFEEGVDNFIDVPGLGVALGRYPVTVGEFQRFVADKGYERREVWDEDGQAWLRRQRRRQPWGWQGQVEHPTRPVTSVSWHEARAYCRWFAARWEAEVRLPTEAEWRFAATNVGEFPWSSVGIQGEIDEAEIAERLANYGLNVWELTPVGVYPGGAGPFGHVDLAGNVWEWCNDGPSNEKHTRHLKGGSWYDDCLELAVTFSIRDGVESADSNLSSGFRLVRPHP